jgi:hypothetical protein
MICLPYTPGRRLLLSFYAAIGASLLMLILAWAALSPASHPPWPAVAAVLMLLPLLGLSAAGLAAYRAWNRCARAVAALSRGCVLRLCYVLVLLPAGVQRPLLTVERPAAPTSGWYPKARVTPLTYAPRPRARDSREAGWRALTGWAAATGNRWACALVPFLVLLNLLDTQADAEVPREIYTLF